MGVAGQHKEVCVKVNAWVDEGVAELVRALNRFPRLVSLSSCEDAEAKGEDGAAVVSFTYGDSTEEIVRFCLWLADELWARLEEEAAVSIVCGAHLGVTGQLRVSRRAVRRVVGELDAIASRCDADREIAVLLTRQAGMLKNAVAELETELEEVTRSIVKQTSCILAGYIVNVRPVGADGYLAHCPTLHATADGKTYDQAIASLRDAMDVSIKGRRSFGSPIPPKDTESSCLD